MKGREFYEEVISFLAAPALVFYGCLLQSVVIPGSVKSIGEGAFNSCKSLTSIIIPDSVKEIGNYAFQGSGNVTVKCYSGSAAEAYAKEKEIPYTLIDDTRTAGDANSDNEVTVADVLLIQQYLAKWNVTLK